MEKILEYISEKFSRLSVLDVIDIVVLAALFFFVYKFIRKRRAFTVLVGVAVFLAVSAAAKSLGFVALSTVMEAFKLPGVIMLAIVFQEDLRAFLEKIGGIFVMLFRGMLHGIKKTSCADQINAVKNAVMRLSATKNGALLVLERNTCVGEITEKGIVLDAKISHELICNIFFSPAPLHDGAMIISKNRIAAAGCFLPNYTSEDLSSSFGSRHRAAIGMSRMSDAGVIIVSEEDGRISYASEGELYRGIDEEKLISILSEYFCGRKTVKSGDKKKGGAKK